MTHMAFDMRIILKTRNILCALRARQDGHKTRHEKRQWWWLTAVASSEGK